MTRTLRIDFVFFQFCVSYDSCVSFAELYSAVCTRKRNDVNAHIATSMPNKRPHYSNKHKKTAEKRFKRDSTLLERLPNELFIETFSYLSDVDIVYAFSQLNHRFQCLIHDCCNTFDFTSVSKSKFKLVIREHDTKQWRSLRLSDDDETPGQVILFSHLFPFAKRVPQLEALSLINMKPKIAQVLMLQLKTFAHLVSLTIGTVCGENIPSLELPSLKHLVVSACKTSKWMKVGN
jgi:hypothetical protein